jgi:hypothetical protein
MAFEGEIIRPTKRVAQERPQPEPVIIDLTANSVPERPAEAATPRPETVVNLDESLGSVPAPAPDRGPDAPAIETVAAAPTPEAPKSESAAARLEASQGRIQAWIVRNSERVAKIASFVASPGAALEAGTDKFNGAVNNIANGAANKISGARQNVLGKLDQIKQSGVNRYNAFILKRGIKKDEETLRRLSEQIRKTRSVFEGPKAAEAKKAQDAEKAKQAALAKFADMANDEKAQLRPIAEAHEDALRSVEDKRRQLERNKEARSAIGGLVRA